MNDECANPAIDCSIPLAFSFAQEARRETNLISIVHAQSDTRALELIHVQHRLLAFRRRVDELQLPGAGRDEVGAAVLVAERVTTDDDRFRPSWHGFGDLLEDDAKEEASLDKEDGRDLR